MADTIKINVEKRDLKSKDKNPQEAMGVIYGAELDNNIHFKVDEMTLRKVFARAGYNHIVDVEVDGKEYEVIFKEVYHRNLEDAIHHVDLQLIKRGEKINADVPIVLVGETPAKQAGHVLVQLMDEIPVRTIPKKIPEQFELDITGLEEPGDALYVSDIKHDDEVEIEVEDERIVVKIDFSRQNLDDEDSENDEEGESAAEVPSEHGSEDENPNDETK